MSKYLVIVESPAKAKTINKYLGSNYIVKSSVGHILDLPTNKNISSRKKITFTENFTQEKQETQSKKKIKKDVKTNLVNRIGIDPYNGWQAKYEILPGKEKVVAELTKLAKKADHIYLATDRDREGEAIAWHLREIIGGDDKRFSRVVFNEITKNSICKAFQSPGKLNINRVNAQQARRFVDRIVGYMVSPLLWKKIARGLSAGRVQSVAVRLVVERESAIKAFVPKEFWELHAYLIAKDNLNIQMIVTHNGDKPFKPVNIEQTQIALTFLKYADYKVMSREDKSITSKPPPPFITSTLQQSASTRLHFSVKKTMVMAQSLYEAGYITYMRTDSTNLSQDSLTMVRDYIKQHFGVNYLPTVANKYSNRDNSQEAHEAIRPSNINVLSEQLKNMEQDAKKLYQLIWRQFVACQMLPARYDSTILTVLAGEYRLRASGRTLRFDGWTKVLSVLHQGDEDRTLPMLEVGTPMKLKKFLPSKNFTKPPYRYKEASLVKELEKRGIGRPSTYSTIISTIQDRGYVRLHSRRFYAEKMGEIVTNRLEANFQELMNYDFTARMETNLDQVAKNKIAWKTVLDEFFIEFSTKLAIAEKEPEKGGMRPNDIVIIQIKCPTCSRQMGIRTASTGVFLGCSGYTLSQKERCKTTINLIPEIEILDMVEGDNAETNALRTRHRCLKCSTAMDSYLIDVKHKLHICGNNPACNGYEIEKGNFRIKGYEGPIFECDKCSSEMHLKIGRFGKYMGCTNVKCNNTRKILRNGSVAPPKEDPIPLPELHCTQSNAYFVLRHGSAGIFLSANTFPKSKETRAPFVEELLRFQNLLPEKLRYLSDAPLNDSQGNKTVVRFSRKTKQLYISSEKTSNKTSWSAFYIDGKWIEKK